MSTSMKKRFALHVVLLWSTMGLWFWGMWRLDPHGLVYVLMLVLAMATGFAIGPIESAISRRRGWR
jgi:hypothetical protein